MKYYNPSHKSNFGIMLKSEILQYKLNRTPIWRVRKRNKIFKRIVANIKGKPYCIFPPIYFQEGNNTYIGKNFFCNSGCKFLDHDVIKIGNNVMLGPDVVITTISHPMISEQRKIKRFKNVFEPYGRGNIEVTKPIFIGDNVWIAAKAVICAGVKIGSNSVIGAGSVVTRDIPPNTFACGVPCRVIRQITEDDRLDIDILDT